MWKLTTVEVVNQSCYVQ